MTTNCSGRGIRSCSKIDSFLKYAEEGDLLNAAHFMFRKLNANFDFHVTLQLMFVLASIKEIDLLKQLYSELKHRNLLCQKACNAMIYGLKLSNVDCADCVDDMKKLKLDLSETFYSSIHAKTRQVQTDFEKQRRIKNQIMLQKKL